MGIIKKLTKAIDFDHLTPNPSPDRRGEIDIFEFVSLV